MNNKVFYPVLVCLLLLPIVLIAYYWNQIPDTIPIHYNINMEPDDWTQKNPGIFILPAITTGLAIFMLAVPYIDPKNKVHQYVGTYRGLVLAVVAFMSALQSLEVLKHIGTDIKFNYISIGVLILFIAIGNMMLKLRPSYFVGIRTPWTLENEEVWRRTHRFAGYLWVVTSVVALPIILFTPYQTQFTVLMVHVGIISVLPIAFSYITYQKLHKNNADKP